MLFVHHSTDESKGNEETPHEALGERACADGGEREPRQAETYRHCAVAEARRIAMNTMPLPITPERKLRVVSAKHSHECLFVDATEAEAETDRQSLGGPLPVLAARDSARRQDTVCMEPLTAEERGAFLVDFGWLRERLASE
jgi:hypothetical protein